MEILDQLREIVDSSTPAEINGIMVSVETAVTVLRNNNHLVSTDRSKGITLKDIDEMLNVYKETSESKDVNTDIRIVDDVTTEETIDYIVHDTATTNKMHEILNEARENRRGIFKGLPVEPLSNSSSIANTGINDPSNSKVLKYKLPFTSDEFRDKINKELEHEQMKSFNDLVSDAISEIVDTICDLADEKGFYHADQINLKVDIDYQENEG